MIKSSSEPSLRAGIRYGRRDLAGLCERRRARRWRAERDHPAEQHFGRSRAAQLADGHARLRPARQHVALARAQGARRPLLRLFANESRVTPAGSGRRADAARVAPCCADAGDGRIRQRG